MSTRPPSPRSVSFAEAFRFWLRLGFASFGGPAGQIALMHVELVERRRWISERRFLHALNYCMVLPGPEATQLAIYIGWLLHRTRGGIVAGTLFVLPSLAVLIGLSWVYLVYGSVPTVAAILYGIKPAVVAIVLAAAWRIASRALRSLPLIGIAVAAFLAIGMAGVPFPLVVLAAAVAGHFGGRLAPDAFSIAATHAASEASIPALIDDATPTPEHARFSRKRLAATMLATLACGLAAWLAIARVLGVAHPLAQMGWFFTKAAFLGFGGAYAVLPYILQGAAQSHHWVTPAQMIDGLALGETTPGPLIMIVAFVGFVGGWQAVAPSTAAGIAGACVATFFTFLPSFAFILAGGPLVEATRDDLRLTAPLTAISAAVVGVIASLAVFFARHVFRLDAAVAAWDWIAMLIAAAACVAAFRFRIGPIPLIGACAAAGLVVSYFH